MLELAALHAIIEPYVAVFAAVILSGVAVTIATELSKLKFLSLIPAEKYPRLTAAVYSVIAAIVCLYNNAVNFVVDSWIGWLVIVIGTLLVAAITFNQIVKGSALEVTSTKPIEGTKL